MNKGVVLAADLGGTNLRMAAVDSDGGLLYRASTATPRSFDHGELLNSIEILSRECNEAIPGDHTIEAFGIAAAAVIDFDKGRIRNAPNMPELNGLDLSAELTEKIGVPVTVENDATAAAIGENWLGASRGVASSIFVTLGTGVGGGIILNGIPLRGVDGTAGEIGHICVEPAGVACGCGSTGCVEQYSSATAIMRMANELQKHYPDSLLKQNGELTPLNVFDAGMNGDELAVEVFRRMGSYLGIALADLVNVLNPEVIVIGGGAAAGWELFIEHLRAEVSKRAFKQPAERAKIIRAQLGNDAGILGAARLAFIKLA
ncbi:MAG: ROK family protein [Saprospiraceae bacterium]|nr:ROK family protein [Pyrinomonadaceae bacterium]